MDGASSGFGLDLASCVLLRFTLVFVFRCAVFLLPLRQRSIPNMGERIGSGG